MLWYKNWLETRWLLVLLTVPYAALLLLAAMHESSLQATPQPSQALTILRSTAMTYFVATLAIVLAGTGVNPQKRLYARRENSQGRILLTLSLPVTRFRLLAVRAGLGWLEVAAGIAAICAGMWAGVDAIRATVAPLEMFKYAAALIASATGVYSLGVMLFSVVTDRVIVWAGMMALLQILDWRQVSVSLEGGWSLGEAASTAAFVMPWPTMGISMACGACLFAAAVKIVRTRDY